MKQKTYRLLNENKYFIQFINGLIVLNVVVIILESYQDIHSYHGPFFFWFEVVSVAIFTAEYLLRIWTADCDPRFTGNSLQKRLGFMTSPLGIVDLLAILPFYIPYFFQIDFRVLRVLRLFRLVRIFKLGRYSRSVRMIQKVLRESKVDLTMSLIAAFVLLTISATLMYYVEGDVQPDKFTNIGQSFWWAIATLTTVGYGDIYPVTATGKFLSSIIALIGIAFIALPTAIISTKFIDEIQKELRRNDECTCPNCGTVFKPNHPGRM